MWMLSIFHSWGHDSHIFGNLSLDDSVLELLKEDVFKVELPLSSWESWTFFLLKEKQNGPQQPSETGALLMLGSVAAATSIIVGTLILLAILPNAW